MERQPNPLKKTVTRRTFMGTTARLAAGAALVSTGACAGAEKNARRATPLTQPQAWQSPDQRPRVEVSGSSQGRVLLKDGLVVDGTGKPAFYGDVLIQKDRIEAVTPGRIQFDGPAVDCTGKVVAPGFIDAHSHMDWVLPMTDRTELSAPFTEQGVTTVVAGNCGFGVAGFKKDSPHRDMLTTRVHGMYDLYWNTMAEYFDHLRRIGISHNLVNLSGHGTTRTSIRGFDPTPMTGAEMKALTYLLEETLEQGAAGVSFGLQYEPGVFASMDEMKQVAKLVKKKDKIITVHMKAYSSLSGTYPLKFFGRPHNLLAIEDMITLARETGVRLQISHLIFVGERTWGTCNEALDLIDAAIGEGLDIQFDTYAYHCGTSVINVFLPEWFLARIPEGYNDGSSLFRLRMEIMLIEKLLGFGYDDIQITDARHPDLEQFNGMFIADIAKKRGLSPFENFVDMARKSEGRARVLNHRYSNMENIERMMQHPASLFMTDATPALAGVQNPGAYGNFPLFLQYARDRRLMTLEDCIRKMTGASADRFAISGRGYLKPGMAADITVFDWEKIQDNNTREATDRKPTGIDHVFINGARVLNGGLLTNLIRPGRVL
ncbi:MAG: amidohydrolase family protein [Desulfobacterales bacterium]|nr:amidohydrolase family protein [Desulfobacterales bacterium]